EPTEGGALPHAGEDHCPKYPGDFTYGRDPSKSRYSLAEEDSGRVRIDKYHPSGIDTCLPDPLCILLIYCHSLTCVSSHRKLGSKRSPRALMWECEEIRKEAETNPE